MIFINIWSNREKLTHILLNLFTKPRRPGTTLCIGIQMFSPSPNVVRKPKINNTERLSARWQEGQGEFTGPVQPLPARLGSCADDASWPAQGSQVPLQFHWLTPTLIFLSFYICGFFRFFFKTIEKTKYHFKLRDYPTRVKFQPFNNWQEINLFSSAKYV